MKRLSATLRPGMVVSGSAAKYPKFLRLPRLKAGAHKGTPRTASRQRPICRFVWPPRHSRKRHIMLASTIWDTMSGS
jgi:hypothetical protein